MAQTKQWAFTIDQIFDWKQFIPLPGANNYMTASGGSFDEVIVVSEVKLAGPGGKFSVYDKKILRIPKSEFVDFINSQPGQNVPTPNRLLYRPSQITPVQPHIDEIIIVEDSLVGMI